MTGEYILTPVDENAIAFSRTPAMVLDIAYLSGSDMTVGGFFPNGVNVSILYCMVAYCLLIAFWDLPAAWYANVVSCSLIRFALYMCLLAEGSEVLVFAVQGNIQ